MAWDSQLDPVSTAGMTADPHSTIHTIPTDESTRAGSAIVASSSRLFRDALREVLKIAGITVIADGASVAEVVEQLGPHAWPDIGICSIDGNRDKSLQEISAIGHAYKRYPAVKWTILDKSVDPEVIQKAAQIGAHGFLLYDVSAGILLRSIELVILGQKLFPVEVIPLSSVKQETSSTSVRHNVKFSERPLPVYDRSVSLSQREDQILQCLVNGYSNKAIARELSIAEATVKVHIKALLRKVKVANRTQVAVWALNHKARMQLGDTVFGLPTPQQEPTSTTASKTQSSEAPSEPIPGI